VNGNLRSTTTAGNGSYTLANLPVDDYDVTAEAFGYGSKTLPVTVADGTTTTRNFRLNATPAHTVSGTVSAGMPLWGAEVEISGTPIAPATTDAAGGYSFAGVPEGTYTFEISYPGCASPRSVDRTVDGDESFNFGVTRRTDTYGHRCDLQPRAWVNATTPLALSGDDASAAVVLPFTFSHYGTGYTTANVSTNGHLSFPAASTAFSNTAIPNAAAPNAAVYPEWDDLFVDASSAVFTDTKGAAPNRRFVILWSNIRPYNGIERWDFEVVLYESGRVMLQYRGVDANLDRGASATVGIENAAGNDALQWSFNEALLSNGQAILFLPPLGGPF
jgi:hypothetical protein